MTAVLDAPGVLGGLASRLDFEALLGDDERLLKVRTALPALALVPEHLVLREALSQPFDLVLDCVSTSANFELKRLIGEQITVDLKHADGRYVPWHGYVREAAQLGSDGGLARYRLTMGPWLDRLALRTDCFVFQDKTVVEIVEEVFADHPAAQWRWNLGEATLGSSRQRSLCTQYRESDLAFVARLLADEGLHYAFEHLADDAAAEADAQGRARHVMVIADAQADAQAERAAGGNDTGTDTDTDNGTDGLNTTTTTTDLGPIRFAAQHPSAFEPGLEDPITAFTAERRLTPNAVTVGSWDYARLVGTSASVQSSLDLGEVPTLEAYDGSGAYRHADAEAADRAAGLALAAGELRAKRFSGTGGARKLRPGARFALIDHPSYGANTTAPAYAGAALASHLRDDNAFTVLAVLHEASNNLGSQAARLLGQGAGGAGALERGTYRNRFACVHAAVPVVPEQRRWPTAPAALTARVVGIDGSVATADRGQRVKVQMHFQRGERPNPGGRALGPESPGFGAERPHRPVGNAPGDERSGTWVRVAVPAAGADWGTVLTPRIGAEVVVQFIEGDIDRPVVVGGLHAGPDARPLAAGVDSAVNHPGVISGLHSQRHDGAGVNQLALDDAPGQLRARLHASHALAELGLGHLIQQSAETAQRGPWRGSGFEASTTGWASLRAAGGLLVSASGRVGTYGSAQSTQMDAAEAVAQLGAARALGTRLGQAAGAVAALGLASHADGQALDRLVGATCPSARGRHPPSVNGRSALQPGADGRSAGTEPVPAFATPVVVLQTPASLLAATPASLTAFAAQALSIVAHGDVQQTAAHTSSQASGRTTSVYAHAGGVTAIAAAGPLSVRAHTDALSILADGSVTVTSVNDEIRIDAKGEIGLVAGQSGITLRGGDVEFVTPGAFTVRAGAHAFEGGGSGEVAGAALPEGTLSPAASPLMPRYDEQVVFKDRHAAPIDGVLLYRVQNRARAGQFDVGSSPTKGEARRLETSSSEPLDHELRFERFRFDR